MTKEFKTPEEIQEEINNAMQNSNALDGDCKDCQVRRICQIPEDEQIILGRNWNIDMVSGECQGDCKSVLEQIAKEVGNKFEANW